jgi:hypothetical protein
MVGDLNMNNNQINNALTVNITGELRCPVLRTETSTLTVTGPFLESVIPEDPNIISIGRTDRKFKDAHLSGTLYTPTITTANPTLTPLNLQAAQIQQNGEPLAFVKTSARSDTASLCTFAGINCGNITATGAQNTGFGENALSSLTDGPGNSAFGRRAGEKINTGFGNVALGDSSMRLLEGGNFNTTVGFNTCNALITGASNVVIGTNANVSDANANHRIAIGFESVCDTDRHCVIGAPSGINSSTLCIKPGEAGTCDLGTEAVPFKDAHLSGAVYAPNVQTSFITSGVSGNPIVVDDDYSGALLPPTGATLTGTATFAGLGYIELTPSGSIGNLGGVEYNFPAGTIGNSNLITAEYEMYVRDTTGDDGNGFSFWFGTVAPSGNTLGSNAGNSMISIYTYDPPPGETVQTRIAVNGAVLDTSPQISQFLDDTWYNVKIVITNKTDVGWYLNNTLIHSYTLLTPIANTETKIGIVAANLGRQGAYRIRNFKLTAPVEQAVTVDSDLNLTGKFNGLTPIGGVFCGIADKSGSSPASNVPINMVPDVSLGSLTIPGNGFKVGDSYHLKIGGIISTSSNNHNVAFDILATTGVLATTQVIDLGNLTNSIFEIELDFTVRAIGGAGVANIVTNGQFTVTEGTVYLGEGILEASANTFDSTVENSLQVFARFGFINDTILVSHFVLTKTF